MLAERLGPGATAAEVLRGLGALAARRGGPPPAALIGSWFGAAAVIAPGCTAAPVDPADAFTAARHGTVDARGADGHCGARAGWSGPPAVGGGWIGYRAYPDGTSPVPRAAGGWTDHVLVQDHDGCWWWESLTHTPCPGPVRRLVHDMPRPAAPGARTANGGDHGRSWSIDWRAPDARHHRRAVGHCLDAIAAGEIYQACVCTAFIGALSGAPLGFFADAAAATSPARAAFVQGDWGAVASLSPETFLTRRGRRVESCPIKGTAPLSATRDSLRRSAKDVAENIMIVDLVRNDLGRVAQTGSVRAERLLEVRPAPGVWHLVSSVAAEMRPEVTDADLLAAAFPPASVTGTPKLRARELLAGWESTPRGAYCGTVGMASPIGGLELNVAIRTVQFDRHGNAVLGVGGGITADSDPEAEWRECLDKASSIVGL